MHDYDFRDVRLGRPAGGAVRHLAVNALAASFGLNLAGFLIYAMAVAASAAGARASSDPEAGLASLFTALAVGSVAIASPLLPRSVRWPCLLAVAGLQFFFAALGVLAFFS